MMMLHLKCLLTLFLSLVATLPSPTPLDQYSNASLLWGPYRPNLYFGIRPRMPEGLLMGIMWSNADDAAHISTKLRHTCEQNEGMAGYGWTVYDPRKGGNQVIHDTGNMIDLNIDFIKNQAGHGEVWGLRVKGILRDSVEKTRRTTVVFYIGHQAPQPNLECDLSSSDGEASCKGWLAPRRFKLRIVPVIADNSINNKPVITSVQSMHVPSDTLWQTKSIFLEQLKKQGPHQTILSSSPGPGNLQLIQLTFVGDLEFNVLFDSDSDTDYLSQNLRSDIVDAANGFKAQFSSVYSPQAPFDTVDGYSVFSQSLLSNLLGGIGYFYGTSKISADPNAEKATLTGADAVTEDRGPHELFTAVPSRPFFPRGFWWDEGFHLQLVLEWDIDLAMEMVTSWFDLMDEDGWIAREQILGPEAASKVPPEFQTQYRLYANPPTMFIVVEMFLDRVLGEVHYQGHASKYINGVGNARDIPPEARAFLEDLYLKLKKHYFWWRRTQAGKLDEYQRLHPAMDKDYTEAYRWRGRTPQHVLTSGLDDYPRAPIPSNDELHLDALCWVGLMSNTLTKISSTLQLTSDPDFFTFARHNAEVGRTAAEIHWSVRDKAYCDVTISNAGKVEHICHKGYISLMPLITGVLSNPSEPKLRDVLDLIEDPNHLWSPYGLRSLSTKDKYYGTEENYWRSPIWVNINYLVLARLLDLAKSRGPEQERCSRIYTELRKNIVNTVYLSWKDTGFAWEQYSPDTGKGQRTQHFTGWTALIVKIMAMPDIEGQKIKPLPNPANVIKDPLPTSGHGVLIMLSGIFLLVIVCRRKFMQVWRSLMDT